MKKKGMSTAKLFIIVLIAAIVCGAAGSLFVKLFGRNSSMKPQGIASAPAIGETDEIETRYGEEATDVSTKSVSTDDVSAIAENVMPSIVSIDCTIVNTYQGFFGRNYEEESKASGTGFIIGQNGKELLIATNNHVVEGAKKIEVTFADESKGIAAVKGNDEVYDLAVVSVDLNSLSDDTLRAVRIAVLGDSDSVGVGSMVVAIGNALGYGQSLTVGYISALDREITIDNRTMTLIQTDAAINPGNSGGPLLNIYGQVIGINSAKTATTEVEGVGYAIPITRAIPIINELMNREELHAWDMAYLGITGKNIEKSYATGFNKPMGVYVYSIDEGSPAEKVGIVFGDIITSIGGRTVSTMEEIQNYLSHTRAGTTTEIVLQRLEEGEYKEMKLSVILENRR